MSGTVSLRSLPAQAPPQSAQRPEVSECVERSAREGGTKQGSSRRGCARGKPQEAGWGNRGAVDSPVFGAAGRERWPVARPSGTRGRRRAPDGAPGQTPPTAAGTRYGRHVATAKRCARPVGHASECPHHAQGGRECVRGVVAPRGYDIRGPGGGTSGRPQRPRRVAAIGWCGRGVGASGCPPRWGHQGLPPRTWEAWRRLAASQARRVSGWRGVPEAGRRPQRATPALYAGRAAPLAARRAQCLRRAVSHGRWSGGAPCRRGRGGVRGPASPVARASCLGVGPTAPSPRAGAQAQGRKAGSRGATPRASCRAHAAQRPR